MAYDACVYMETLDFCYLSKLVAKTALLASCNKTRRIKWRERMGHQLIQVSILTEFQPATSPWDTTRQARMLQELSRHIVEVIAMPP